MNTEVLGVIAQIVLMVVLSNPLGKYIAKVYKGEKTWSDFMKPVERVMFKLSGINPNEEMNWKQFLRALLVVNLFWFLWGMVLLVTQGVLPLNPDGNVGQTAHQAFNTCISFMVNCNLQHYSGESGLTYFTQLFVIMLFQFITAATGMAAMAGIMKALAAKTTQTIGNFWNYLVLSCTRVLLPLSLIVGFILIVQGTPMGFDGKMKVTTMEGTTQYVSQGPTAAIVPIKQLGTNGGGYFGVNSSHPLENPTYFANMVECWSIHPTPTPPNHVLICMFSISIIPESGIVESCIPLTEPLEVTVVVILHKAVAAEPKRISLPSIAPLSCAIPISSIRGLPPIS